eukprot:266236-Alexandrium_andersonii.AAC.1
MNRRGDGGAGIGRDAFSSWPLVLTPCACWKGVAQRPACLRQPVWMSGSRAARHFRRARRSPRRGSQTDCSHVCAGERLR